MLTFSGIFFVFMFKEGGECFYLLSLRFTYCKNVVQGLSEDAFRFFIVFPPVQPVIYQGTLFTRGLCISTLLFFLCV